MLSGGINWNALNPFNYDYSFSHLPENLEAIGGTVTNGVEAAKNIAISTGKRIAGDSYTENLLKLPILALALPLTIFGSSCRGKIKTQPAEDNTTLDFKEDDNPLAYELYQGLLKEGVKPSEMDIGYSVINYDGIHCSEKEAKSCIKDANNQKIKPEEVFEYALNNDLRFQKLLEKTLGDPLPCVLDDLDPTTPFDAGVREKVNNTIGELRNILLKQGFKKDTDAYKERLAVGLFWFVTLPPKDQFDTDSIIFKFAVSELDKSGLGEFKNHLKKEGGLRIKFRADELTPIGVPEYTALESLQNNNGDCSEHTNILYAVFRMAGLEPQFVAVNLTTSDANTLGGPDELRSLFANGIKEFLNTAEKMDFTYMDFNHSCIGLIVGERLRLFDSMHFQSDAKYARHQSISERYYSTLIYANQTAHYLKNNEIDKAKSTSIKSIAIDSMNPLSHYNLGFLNYKTGLLDKAMANSTQAITLYPSFSDPYLLRGAIYLKKGYIDKATLDFTQYLKLEPTEYEKVYQYITEDYTALKWKNDPRTEAFTDDIISPLFPIYKYEAIFMMSGILWEAGNKNAARKELDKIADGFHVDEEGASEFTINFFEDMFKYLPADMQEDAEAKEMISSIREELEQAE